MSKKIMRFLMVILLVTTGLSACTKADPDPDTKPDPDKPAELSSAFLGDLGNITANLANGGFAVENGGWVYISDPLDFNRLAKMKADGSDKTRLSKDWNVGMINVIGEWIYYVPGTWFIGQGSINRIKTDGTAKEVVVANPVRALVVKGNYLYYLDSESGNLIRSKLDGKEPVVLVQGFVQTLTLSGESAV